MILTNSNQASWSEDLLDAFEHGGPQFEYWQCFCLTGGKFSPRQCCWQAQLKLLDAFLHAGKRSNSISNHLKELNV